MSNVDNGSLVQVVIPNVFEGQGGRQGDRIAINIGRGRGPAIGNRATVDDRPARITSSAGSGGWWTFTVAMEDA